MTPRLAALASELNRIAGELQDPHGVRIARAEYETYVEQKRKQGEEPLDKHEWERKVLGVPDGHETGAAKLHGFVEKHGQKLKDHVHKSLSDTHDHFKKVVSDPEYRKKTLSDLGAKLKSGMKDYAKKAVHELKHFGKEHKEGVKAIGKLAQGKKLNKHEAHALFHTALNVTAVTLAGVHGGLLVAGGTLGKNLVRHVASNAVHKYMGKLNTTHEGAHVTYELLHTVMGSSNRRADDEGGEDAKIEKIFNDILELAHAELNTEMKDEDVVHALNGNHKKSPTEDEEGS